MASPIESQEFIEWFAGSKVVDKSGRPRIVYHGTSLLCTQRTNFAEFRTPAYFANQRDSESSGLGALDYAGENGVIIPVYLSIKNPVEFDVPHDFGELAYDPAWVESMKQKDYDGMHYKDRDGEDLWVAFTPSQIRLAFDE